MVIPLLMERDAQQVQSVGVIGLGAEDAAVPPDGLGQQSVLVFLQTEGKLVVHADAHSILKWSRGAHHGRDRGTGALPDGSGQKVSWRAPRTGRDRGSGFPAG
jgi:hypothetical protein